MAGFKARLPLKLVNPLGTFLAWKPWMLLRGVKVTKTGLNKKKPPFVLLINHSSRINYKIACASIFPYALNLVIPSTDFDAMGDLSQLMGSIPKNCCYTDVKAIQHIKRIKNKGGVIALFVEELPSVDGRIGYVSPAVAKLIKRLELDVYTMKISGAYLCNPFFSQVKRNAKINVQIEEFLLSKDIEELDVPRLYTKIVEKMQYDEYMYQRDNKINITNSKLLNGVDGILYRCPICKAEYTITAQGNKICCSNCNNIWTMGRHGVIISEAKGSIMNLPIWMEYQKKVIEAQMKEGTYSVTSVCKVFKFNKTKYQFVGNASFLHNRTALMLVGNIDGVDKEIIIRNTQMHGIRFGADGWIDVIDGQDRYRIEFETKQIACQVSLSSMVLNNLYTEARLKRQFEYKKRFDVRYKK